eukprot:6209265-Pleurochrysis_carterae.AAC.5
MGKLHLLDLTTERTGLNKTTPEHSRTYNRCFDARLHAIEALLHSLRLARLKAQLIVGAEPGMVEGGGVSGAGRVGSEAVCDEERGGRCGRHCRRVDGR